MEQPRHHEPHTQVPLEHILMQNDDFIARCAVGEEDMKWVPTVATWTQTAQEMIPKTHEEVELLFRAGRSVLIFDKSTQWAVGHVAFTFYYTDGKIELGSLCTDENTRGRGVATLAIQAALLLAGMMHPGASVFAMANQFSEKIFISKLGGTEISCERVDPNVWNHCPTCPMNSGPRAGNAKPCVHTPVDLTHLVPAYAHDVLS